MVQRIRRPRIMKRNSAKKPARLNGSFCFPDLDHAKTAVLSTLSSSDSQRSYRFAIDDFIGWYCSEPRLGFNKAAVLGYRLELQSRHLASSTINLRLAAVRRLAYEAADTGLMSPESAAGIRRVKGARQLGVRLGNWLTADEAKALLDAPDVGAIRGKRSRAILALCLTCGLRRSELAHLTMEHLQRREDHWAIVDLVGKGGHIRTVPVPDWVKIAVDGWTAAAGVSTGRIFRCVNKSGSVWGTGITEKVVWAVVKECAARARIAKLAPHDLRRTCARLCHVAGGELEQIQFLLGHVSVQTTEQYLGCRQKLRNAVNDRIGIEPEAEFLLALETETRHHSTAQPIRNQSTKPQ
jgi:site-specific recombinase XerD